MAQGAPKVRHLGYLKVALYSRLSKITLHHTLPQVMEENIIAKKSKASIYIIFLVAGIALIFWGAMITDYLGTNLFEA